MDRSGWRPRHATDRPPTHFAPPRPPGGPCEADELPAHLESAQAESAYVHGALFALMPDRDAVRLVQQYSLNPAQVRHAAISEAFPDDAAVAGLIAAYAMPSEPDSIFGARLVASTLPSATAELFDRVFDKPDSMLEIRFRITDGGQDRQFSIAARAISRAGSEVTVAVQSGRTNMILNSPHPPMSHDQQGEETRMVFDLNQGVRLEFPSGAVNERVIDFTAKKAYPLPPLDDPDAD